MQDIANTRQFEEWNGADGLHWAAHRERYDRMSGGYDGPLFEAAGLGADHHVLDVGCGTGQTTRSAARIAVRGQVVGLDLSEPMLECARRSAAAEGITNATFEQGDAQVHPLPPGRFDAVISRAGVMFFADPVAAFANIATATRPGGRLAFACHRTPGEAVQQIFAAAAAHLPVPDLAEQAPGVVDFTDPDKIRSVLTGAGYTAVAVDGFEAPCPIGRDTADAADFLFSTHLKRFAEGADATARARAREAVRTSLLPFESDGTVEIPARGWLVTAVRP